MTTLVTPTPATAERITPPLQDSARAGHAGVLAPAVLCGILFFFGLNAGELWGNESLRAAVAAEMLRTGDWIVPHLYGEPLLTKPPGMYIAIALCSLPLGHVSEFSARLPSALAATATVFLVYWYFARELGARGGFLAALILPLSKLWLEKASSGDIDMLLVFWTTAAILLFLRGWSVAAMLCVAGGFLTKWTTPAFFYATVLPFLWWRGELRWLWSRGHLVGLGLAALICAAWLVAVIAQVGVPAFSTTLEQEALQRLVPTYGGRPYPWGQALLHPLTAVAVGLPFSALALVTLWPGFYQLWDERGRRLLQALHCWAWPNLLLWSLATEHKPHFIFPLIPALSGLAAMVLLACTGGPLAATRRGAWCFAPGGAVTARLVVAVVVVWIAVKIGYAHGLISHRGHGRSARDAGQHLARLVPEDHILYLLDVRDDALLFYCGRSAQRLHSRADVPAGAGAVYCLVPESLRHWTERETVQSVQEITDAQGEPLLLLRVTAP